MALYQEFMFWLYPGILNYFILNHKLNIMGRGDKKTKRGKISKGSYGNSRPRETKEKLVPAEEKTVKPKKKKA